MKLPQLLHSTRSYGQANSAFSWKLLVLERGFLSYRLKLPCDRSEKDAWFGYSPVGALRKLPFILYSRPAEDWLQRSGSSSTISLTTLFFAIVARGRRSCSRNSALAITTALTLRAVFRLSLRQTEGLKTMYCGQQL